MQLRVVIDGNQAGNGRKIARCSLSFDKPCWRYVVILADIRTYLEKLILKLRESYGAQDIYNVAAGYTPALVRITGCKRRGLFIRHDTGRHSRLDCDLV